MGKSDIPDTSAQTIATAFFSTLEQKFGEDIIKLIFTLLIASRNGIKANTMIELLKRSNQLPLSNQSIERFWSHFCWLLSRGPILLHNRTVRLMDKYVHQIATARYEAAIENAHRVLHEFYAHEPDEFSDADGQHRCLNEPKFNELPYHAVVLDQPTFSESTYLTDLRWIQHKIQATKFMQTILNDIALVERTKRNQCDHIRILTTFIETYLQAINYDAGQFYPLLKHYLNAADGGIDAQHDICKKWLDDCNSLGLPYLDIREGLLNTNADAKPCGYDLIANLGGYFVASMSTKREEICVWNVSRYVAGDHSPDCMRSRRPREKYELKICFFFNTVIVLSKFVA